MSRNVLSIRLRLQKKLRFNHRKPFIIHIVGYSSVASPSCLESHFLAQQSWHNSLIRIWNEDRKYDKKKQMREKKLAAIPQAAIPQAFFFLRQLVAFCRMDPMGGLCWQDYRTYPTINKRQVRKLICLLLYFTAEKCSILRRAVYFTTPTVVFSWHRILLGWWLQNRVIP